MEPQTLRVSSKPRGYDIIIGRGSLAGAGGAIRAVCPPACRKVAVVTDSNVSPLYADTVRQSIEAAGLTAAVFVFPAGEPSKNHATLLGIYAFLAREQITRTDAVAALGGGVVGDTAGFAAATFLRGVTLVQLPTTLLAQIDSSVGGKTGVDLPEGKNLVGAFYAPHRVLCDPDTLATLPPRVFRDGLAEAFKYGCIFDRALFGLLERSAGSLRDDALDRVIARCIGLKRDVVERDAFESGERMLLNFGHTLGHALEKCFHYETYTHGEAVGIGMALAARAGEKQGLTAPGTAETIAAALEKAGLPERCPVPVAQLLPAVLGDKKRAGDTLRVVLLKEIGQSFIHSVPIARLGEFFDGSDAL